MGLPEIVLAALASLCFNATCVDHYSDTISRSRYQVLKDDLQHENFIITTLKNGPLSGYIVENGTLIGTGVAFDIVKILQKEYKFSYTLVKPDDDMFEPSDGKNGGVKEMLINQKVHIAAAFLPIQYNDVVEYSRGLDTAQWVVLMKRPKESATGSGLLAPFTATVWTLIIISLLAVGPILYIVVFLRAKICKDDDDIVFSLPACMWFVYGALLKQGSTLNPRTDSSRILFSTWWIFITILTAFYTANLTAFLTLSKFTLPISEPRDIVKKQYKWVTNKGNGIVEEINESREYSSGDGKSLYEQIGNPKIETAVEEEVILSDFVTRRNLMYIREKTVLETLMYEDYKRKIQANVSEKDRCTYVITDFPVCTFPRAFAFAPGFKYKPLFDFTIQHLSESGITAFKQREFLPDTTICPLNLGNKERRLRNADLIMTYMIVGGGLIISTVIFIIELILYYFNLNNRCCGKAEFNNRERTDPLFKRKNENNNIITFGNAFKPAKDFVTPPPSYHMLFGPPPGKKGTDYTKKTINGRDYWVINDKNGNTSLIPQRAPSALLFQFTN
ncbi:glutamate receptor ionotropic, delta-2 [Sitophilus oryzae]|uniref:Glutamate receptor ionotropic, delta-2 n=1 Tax=Sitophilus oryzae TaxID=7048 RepID=A0A6J2XI21_SITOR|nr:glutamate receptor ionotropic, delta-2 [Sitophilus oryzae]